MAKNIALGLESVDSLASDRQTGRERARPTFWQRFFAAMEQSRRRQAEREIARFIAMRGGTLTDEVEREISRKFGGLAGRGW